MKIRFELELEDWLAFQKDFFSHSPHHQRSQLMMRWMVPVAFAFLLVLELGREDFSRNIALVLGGLAAAWYLLAPRIHDAAVLARIRRLLRRADLSAYLGVHEVEFTVQGVHTRRPGEGGMREEQVPWSEIHGLQETAKHGFLYVTEDQALILPKEKLANGAQDAQHILAFIREQLVPYNPKG